MHSYDVIATETNTVVYFVRADSEDEARAAVVAGDYDDYKTVESTLEDIVEIERTDG